MASAEQPLKKRKLYEHLHTEPSPPPQSPPQPKPPSPPPLADTKSRDDTPVERPPTPPLSQDDLLRRRRCQEEVRNAYLSFKTLKRCASSGDAHLKPELERAFLSLLTASRGCASVQRIVSECIPKYASYSPTALEAATQVIINMHNWNLALLNGGENVDEISFEIARNCIVGLVDICLTACSVARTSSVIQGICSAVFHCVLAFFSSMLEGKPIFQVIDLESLRMQDSPELYSELEQKVASEDGPLSVKLSKLRALSFLQIIFRCPENLLAICFDLFNAPASDGFCKQGKYLFDQLISRIHPDNESLLGGESDPSKASASCLEVNTKRNDVGSSESVSHSNCLLGLVLNKDPSLKRWMFSRYKKVSKLASSQASSDFRAVLDGFFKSFNELCKDEDREVHTDEGDGDASNYIRGQFHKPRSHNLQKSSSEVPGDYHSKCNSNYEISDSTSTEFKGGEQQLQAEKIQASNVSYSGAMNRMDSASPFRTNGSIWYADGDPAAMDVISASRQLWLGFSTPEASDASIRYQLERYGPIDYFYFNAAKGFALVEYRGIMDAVKARLYMGDHSPRDGRFRIKFMDTSLGSRGAIDGVAVGSCCHVFVGNVFSRWMKDDILRETTKVIYRGPRMVTELATEGALLLEFESPEEATCAMTCLRQHRRGSNTRTVHSSGTPDMVRSHGSYASNMAAPAMQGSPQIRSITEGHAGKHAAASLASGMDSGPPAFVSPRHWHPTGGTGVHDIGTPKCDSHGSSAIRGNPPKGGTPETMWMYRKPELEHYSAPGTTSCMTVPTPGPTITPPQSQAPTYTQPNYYPANSSWDSCSSNHHIPTNQMPTSFMPNNTQLGPVPPPFLPASVTPLSHMKGGEFQQYNQMVSQPPVVPYLSGPPPKPDMPPPLPPSPPPIPPPPCSPPPPPPPPESEPSTVGINESSLQIQWQGMLSKSGVRYCTIHARRLDSDICKYSNALFEPVEWPAKLDMTKRTDFRHVKSAFSNTPPHKREVCQLLPSTSGDHKGFQDFMSYLKQRDCAGVIKISALKSIWARLLFILPYSPEACSLLGVTLDSSDCLIALVLPKDSNLE